MMGGWMTGGGMGGAGWLGMILFWGLVIFGIVALVNWTRRGEKESVEHEESPLEILKQRYAHGEIDRTEFQEKKRDLG
jgi:putative membrane protein